MAQSMNDGMNTRTDARERPGQGIANHGIGGAVVALFDTVATWNERRRQRRALEALPDHLLQDIGLSRADAVTEADKPFWQG
ncbi:hypothetical protein ABAZ39_19030 (plasmid) [Azospirillum argentinense]|uniref:DUF1127 domain-containing protein n=1 Tax=Azospirillum argentinense TaxID=2970906 RepID=A0A2K1G3K5_9PROT|nr:DUF1127 domain-containing protein [Azospirillum argentinense]AIB14021.1 hypothetical protein ABAZ39_19030 [Azospirillum argentinense]EZQ05721.1 hypothetical protein ABAZ39_19075 [Azospirillum argentinense]KAA1055035.1 hypothetical protein FH063_005597 [Azospirillum argentinense]MBK3798057.1 DUF1127 domain-containing protein [Azospirillum argentinense]PNQ99374.1 DUF1127 domain-containing protein [Azospirillum argentinense]